MKYISPSLIALSMALLCGVAVAHQDTRLKFKDGKIIGLPERYLPATFDVEELSVTIAAKKLILPEVFQRLLKKDVSLDPFDESPRKFEPVPCSYTFSASWYHESLNAGLPSDLVLPPYILISISPTGRNFHFELLIDMDHIKILRADLVVKDLGSVPIDVDDGIRVRNKKNGEQAVDGNPH